MRFRSWPDRLGPHLSADLVIVGELGHEDRGRHGDREHPGEGDDDGDRIPPMRHRIGAVSEGGVAAAAVIKGQVHGRNKSRHDECGRPDDDLRQMSENKDQNAGISDQTRPENASGLKGGFHETSVDPKDPLGKEGMVGDDQE